MLNENEVKHLELIQSVVSRLAGNSASTKTWCVTLVAAIFALSAKDANQNYFILALLPVIVFWMLDSYYLSQERAFRALYDAVRTDPSTLDQFTMDTRPVERTGEHKRASLSATILPFYGVLVLAVSLVAALR